MDHDEGEEEKDLFLGEDEDEAEDPEVEVPEGFHLEDPVDPFAAREPEEEV
jgi:hypothetical protein